MNRNYPAIERFLILEWCGKWIIPDHEHGGVYAGPYAMEHEAIAAREKYAQREYDACMSTSTPVGISTTVEYAQGAKADILARHTIIPVLWPRLDPEGNEVDP